MCFTICHLCPYWLLQLLAARSREQLLHGVALPIFFFDSYFLTRLIEGGYDFAGVKNW
jgi:hypothetical protein